MEKWISPKVTLQIGGGLAGGVPPGVVNGSTPEVLGFFVGRAAPTYFFYPQEGVNPPFPVVPKFITFYFPQREGIFVDAFYWFLKSP